MVPVLNSESANAKERATAELIMNLFQWIEAHLELEDEEAITLNGHSDNLDVGERTSELSF